ncbi:MAG: sugar phosphate nucleotidyltransferase [Candidatus Neomarinimicrobiota bacterium]|nr:sugar phosphate nucleotidyltransferase [Candidatus Neomarinimicrobiota bacterium]
MRDLTLLVMAAGMGSRYGGLKQLDPVGPNGETIIDYSVYDAIQAGFNKAVFIIREEFKSDFENQITNKYNDSIAIEFAIQDLNNLPSGYSCPDFRVKPWGTGQAILSASDIIDEPFAAINGDDFYGRESFQLIADCYHSDFSGFSMVAFQLDNTLSDYGGVSRGVCTVRNDHLVNIIETHEIIKTENAISSKGALTLDGSEPVSMNMWGFTPKLFSYLEAGFISFLDEYGYQEKSEYLIPSVINELIKTEQETLRALQSNASWFGVTYKEDKPFVESQILKLVESENYPSKLF